MYSCSYCDDRIEADDKELVNQLAYQNGWIIGYDASHQENFVCSKCHQNYHHYFRYVRPLGGNEEPCKEDLIKAYCIVLRDLTQFSVELPHMIETLELRLEKVRK